jgi:hypothetical protein
VEPGKLAFLALTVSLGTIFMIAPREPPDTSVRAVLEAVRTLACTVSIPVVLAASLETTNRSSAYVVIAVVLIVAWISFVLAVGEFVGWRAPRIAVVLILSAAACIAAFVAAEIGKPALIYAAVLPVILLAATFEFAAARALRLAFEAAQPADEDRTLLFGAYFSLRSEAALTIALVGLLMTVSATSVHVTTARVATVAIGLLLCAIGLVLAVLSRRRASKPPADLAEVMRSSWTRWP